MLVQAIHWFNPLVYAVSRQIDSECEVSCDIAVTSRLTEDEQSRYMNTILLLAANSRSRLRPLTTQMANGKKILQRRFSMIKRKTIFKKKTIIISAVLAVAILTTAVIASGISGNALFKDFSGGVDALNTDKITGGSFNLLFIGLDNGGRADSIMLTAVRNDVIRVVSIPRNTIFQNKRISDILKAENDEQAAIAAIKQTLSAPIHYYVKTDLNAVKKTVDSMGGVEFDVPTDMVYDDPHQNLHIDLKNGTQLLDGEKACHLLQHRRGYTEGDITRIQMPK